MNPIIHHVLAGSLVTACNLTVMSDMETTSRYRDTTCCKCIEKILYD